MMMQRLLSILRQLSGSSLAERFRSSPKEWVIANIVLADDAAQHAAPKVKFGIKIQQRCPVLISFGTAATTPYVVLSRL